MPTDDLTSLSRRQWLKGAAAFGALASLSPAAVPRAQVPASARRLDLHHHFGSPRWIKRVVEVKRQGWQQFETHTPGKAIAAMDTAGVSTAFLSCTEPEVWFEVQDLNSDGMCVSADGRFLYCVNRTTALGAVPGSRGRRRGILHQPRGRFAPPSEHAAIDGRDAGLREDRQDSRMT
jgi:hypothetical protein